MTDYNKKTYRVDDVSWNETPNSTFKMKDGEITYVDYYQKVSVSLQYYYNTCFLSEFY